MGPQIISLRGGSPFLPGPLERSSTVHTSGCFQFVIDFKLTSDTFTNSQIQVNLSVLNYFQSILFFPAQLLNEIT